MITWPLHMHRPLTVSSPPWQLSASVRTQVPPPALPTAGIRLKPDGQIQVPLLNVPPSQAAFSGRCTAISATQRPLAPSACVPEGQVHWPAEFLKLPSRQGLAAAGGGAGGAGGVTEGGAAAGAGGIGGGDVLAGLATHWPFRNSCQGKHP